MAVTTTATGTAPARTAPAPPRRARGALVHWVAVHSLGVAAALFFVLPFVFLFLTSVMDDRQALTRDLWPHTWQWGNYSRVWHTPAS